MMEHTVLVCVADPGLGSSVSPCAPISGVHSAPALLDGYILTAEQGSFFETLNLDFDYSLAAGFFSTAFVSVLGLYFFSKVVGSILTQIRTG